MPSRRTLASFNRDLEKCRQCPRLVRWREQVAREKKASFQSETYWGRPVPAVGDPKAKILIVGLAPGAHGANRTGRPFTGDGAGLWLYPALFEAGLSNQPASNHRGDGLKLQGAYLTNAVRCAPPGNRPNPQERDKCLPFLEEEMALLKNTQVIVALGGFSWDAVLKTLTAAGHRVKPKPRFGHGAQASVGPYHLLGTYHPSQLNTHTGRLTRPMLVKIFNRARQLAGN